jgi:hypothetical protein
MGGTFGVAGYLRLRVASRCARTQFSDCLEGRTLRWVDSLGNSIWKRVLEFLLLPWPT